MRFLFRSRYRLLIGLPALLLGVAACGGDDTSPELAEALDEAGFEEGDFDADELAEAEEMLGGMETELEKPDDFPDEIPLADDARVVANNSFDREEGRSIEIQFAWPGDLDEWIQRYSAELPQGFDVHEEGIAESEDDQRELGGGFMDGVVARWDFSGQGWERATVFLLDAEAYVDGVADAWGIGEDWGERMEERFENEILSGFEGTQVSVLVRLNEGGQ